MITYEVKVDEYGNKSWFLNGKRHREDGPARDWSTGAKCWYLNDELHREDGPACEWSDGNKDWYLNGKRHREDGPAIEWADGDKSWYLNGKRLTEQEFNDRNSSCNGKVIEVDGKKYKLQEI